MLGKTTQMTSSYSTLQCYVVIVRPYTCHLAA
jgi:hypothetical protein